MEVVLGAFADALDGPGDFSWASGQLAKALAPCVHKRGGSRLFLRCSMLPTLVCTGLAQDGCASAKGLPDTLPELVEGLSTDLDGGRSFEHA